MEYTDQDEITPSDEYVKAFNDGYVMAKYNPSFSNDSVSNMPPSDRNKGFSKGMMQFEVEKKLDKTLARMTVDKLMKNKDRVKDKDKDKDRDKDR